jgi:hypothetical protein
MGSSVVLQTWAARFCLGLVCTLSLMGFHFGNVRFAPVVAGFAILSGVFYTWRGQPAAPSRSLATDSGRHRAL